METTKTSLILFAATMGMVILAFIFSFRGGKDVSAASFPAAPAFAVASTTGSISVTTSALVLASTTVGSTRAYATICNPNANPVYINADGGKSASVGNVTMILAAAAGYNACWELTTNQMMYQGSITASSTNQTATTIDYKEYTY